MKDSLTQEEKEYIKEAISNSTFSPQLEIERLIKLGCEPEIAKGLVVAEIKIYKKELFDKAVKKDDRSEVTKLMFVLIFVIALIGPMFSIQSPGWYIIATMAAGVAGYFGYREKPIAGVIAAMVGTIVFPFAYAFYFEGRSSFIRLEMVVPVIISAIPAIISYYIISWLAYPNTEGA